VVGYLVMGGPR